jgi:hypothetical protein
MSNGKWKGSKVFVDNICHAPSTTCVVVAMPRQRRVSSLPCPANDVCRRCYAPSTSCVVVSCQCPVDVVCRRAMPVDVVVLSTTCHRRVLLSLCVVVVRRCRRCRGTLSLSCVVIDESVVVLELVQKYIYKNKIKTYLRPRRCICIVWAIVVIGPVVVVVVTHCRCMVVEGSRGRKHRVLRVCYVTLCDGKLFVGGNVTWHGPCATSRVYKCLLFLAFSPHPSILFITYYILYCSINIYVVYFR